METGEGLATPWFNPTLLLGVHWSLNYEEQFYILCALILILHRQVRLTMIVVAFTAGTTVLNILWPGRVTGLFVDFWLQFFFCALGFVMVLRGSGTAWWRRRDGLLLC